MLFHTLYGLCYSLQVHLAIYSFANNQISSALQVLYRSRYLLLLSFGEQHPDVALVDVSQIQIVNSFEFNAICVLLFLSSNFMYHKLLTGA